MLDVILGRAAGRCDGQTRRDFLRIGAAGALGASLPALFRAEAHGAARAEGKARAKSVAVMVDVEPGLSRVRGFVGELNQIWAHLIDNAPTIELFAAFAEAKERRVTDRETQRAGCRVYLQVLHDRPVRV